METGSGWQILFYRSLFVSLLVLAIVVVRSSRGESPLAAFARSGFTGVVAGLGMAVAFAGFILSLMHTSVANAFFLLATQPFIIALLAWFVLKERLARSTALAAAVTLVGVIVMFYDGFVAGSVKGSAFALLSALGFSAFTVTLRYGRNVDMWPAIFYGGLFALLFAGAMLWLTGESFMVSRADLGWCAVLGVTQIGLGTLAYVAGSRWVSAAELGLLAMTEIVLGPFWAWLVVNEIPTRGTLVGGMIVLVALTGLGLYRVFEAPADRPASVQ